MMGGMHPALREAVVWAHRQMEERSGRYLEAQGLKVSCRKGCWACCLAWVVVGLAEAEYLREQLERFCPGGLRRIEEEGPLRLGWVAQHKHLPDLPRRHFLLACPCPLLTQEGACAAHPHRPLACRGVLTDLEPGYCLPGVVSGLRGPALARYQGRLEPWHGPEHYLKVPWRVSERLARQLWALERRLRGFTVVGELVGLVYLLGQERFQKAVGEGADTVRRWLGGRGLEGGRWGFWVG